MTYNHPNIDFSLKRPFLEFSGDRLLETVEQKLLPVTLDIEIATMALDELKRRKKSTRKARDAQNLFRKAGIKPIPWLQGARARNHRELTIPPIAI